MKIEVGKLYRTRNGMKVRIYATDIEGELPIHGAVYYPEHNFWDTNAWREDGIDGDYQPDFDIIGEWKEPIDFDPDCLPAWAKYIAMDKNKDWRWHRYKPERSDFFWVEPTKWKFKTRSEERRVGKECRY